MFWNGEVGIHQHNYFSRLFWLLRPLENPYESEEQLFHSCKKGHYKTHRPLNLYITSIY